MEAEQKQPLWKDLMKLQLVTITALDVAGTGKYSSLLIDKYVISITQQEETLKKKEAELKICFGNYLKSTESRKSLLQNPLTTVICIQVYRL